LPIYLPKLYKSYVKADVFKIEEMLPELKFEANQVLEYGKPIHVKLVKPKLNNEEIHIELSDSLSPPTSNINDTKFYTIKDSKSGELYTKDGYIIFQKFDIVAGKPNHNFIYPNGKIAEYNKEHIFTN